MKTDYQSIIKQVYDAFNKRDIDAVFAHMKADVHWPNGWEGGYVNGYSQVRDYWTRQWSEITPVVTPVSITELANGTVDVEVHQLVKDKEGTTLFDGILHHLYAFDDDKIKSMEIEK